MDLRRLRAGEWITGVGGVLLLVSLFLAWYRDTTGWEALTVIDIVLALIALSAAALVPLAATHPAPAPPLVLEGLLASLGPVAVVLVVIRMLWLPDTEGLEPGIWLALVASLGITVGAWVAMRDERLSKPGRPTDLTGVPAPPPEIETLPAPRPEAPAP